MRTRLYIALLLGILWVDTTFAQSSDERLNVNGSLLLDDRIRFDKGTLHWQEYRLSLTPSYKFGEKAKFYSDIWIRQLISHSPFEDKIDKLQIREAYIDLYGFLAKNLDLRIGRQRIAWGTADRLSPTDNVNPWEMEDFWDFGRHTPTNSLLAKYYLGNFTIQAIFTPQFTSSILPDQSWLSMMMPTFPQQITLPINGEAIPVSINPLTISQSKQTPTMDLKASSYAVKISGNIGKYSISASWLRQHSPLPMLTGLDVSGKINNVAVKPISMQTDINAVLSFPIRHIVGADFSGSIGSVGIWCEGALFFPEKTTMNRNVKISSPIGDFALPLKDSIILDKKPYFKYTVGFDYTFSPNIYLNMQYVHGFFHEEGGKNLTDYLVWVCEWKSSDEKIKLAPLNGTINVKKFKNFKDSYAVFWLPEASYRPIDNIELILGAHCIFAGRESSFYNVKNNGDLYFKMKVVF